MHVNALSHGVVYGSVRDFGEVTPERSQTIARQGGSQFAICREGWVDREAIAILTPITTMLARRCAKPQSGSYRAPPPDYLRCRREYGVFSWIDVLGPMAVLGGYRRRRGGPCFVLVAVYESHRRAKAQLMTLRNFVSPFG